MKIDRYQIGALGIMIILHIVGLWGLNSIEYQELFKKLTPVNLVITAVIIFTFHKQWDKQFIGFLIITALAGFFMEWLGVETGIIFGTYEYGNTLGIKFLDIPLLIGLNWVILIYCTGVISAQVTRSIYAAALIGAGLMVSIDLFIEPYAIRYDLWHWEWVSVPLRNYAGWFIISFFLHILFQVWNRKKENLIAHAAYIVMFLFFLTDFVLNA